MAKAEKSLLSRKEREVSKDVDTDINQNLAADLNGNNKEEESSKESGKKNGFFHINRNTLPLKISLFLFYGAAASITPYLTIHMRDIGLSVTQIATIYAILPFVAFMGPPSIGFVADKLGQYKLVLVFATIMTGVSYSCLLLVPKCSESSSDSISFAEMEFGGGINGNLVILRPNSPLLCSSFNKSLHLSSDKDSKTNQVINIHSCKESEGRMMKAMKLYPGIPFRPISDIPLTCKWIQSNSTIIGYECGGGQLFPFTTILEEQIALSGCYLNVDISSQMEGQHLSIQRPFPPITCQTNYSFPTGKSISKGSSQLTFWLYFVIRTIANIFMNSCFSLLDATALAVVKKNPGSQYGRERIMCTLGFGIASPISGLLVDQVSKSKGYVDYSAAFYLSNTLIVLNVLGYLFLNLEVGKLEASKGFWKKSATLINFPEVLVFLGMIFVLGTIYGFIESYFFIFLDELQAPKFLLGLTITVSNLTSIPVLYGSKWIIDKVGKANVILSTFLIYLIRCVGYSFIPNAYWCFPFEIMEGFSYQILWVVAGAYCAEVAPEGLIATLTSLMGSLHYGLGKGSGAFIGGFLISLINIRNTFRVFGGVAGTFGVAYFFANRFWLEPTIKKRTREKKGIELA